MNRNQRQSPPLSSFERGTGLFVFLVLLAVAAGAVLVAEGRERGAGRGEEFQRLVGGLGFGPAVDLSVCAFGFDPRLDGACAFDTGAVPGGTCFCPRHAGSVFFYPPPASAVPLPEREKGDGLPP
jgi:hypothetical protein